MKATDIEITSGVSMAVPEQAYSIKELFIRNSLGQSLTIGRVGQFNDSDDFDNDSMVDADFDLSDIPTRYEQHPLGKKPKEVVKPVEPAVIDSDSTS